MPRYRSRLISPTPGRSFSIPRDVSLVYFGRSGWHCEEWKRPRKRKPDPLQFTGKRGSKSRFLSRRRGKHPPNRENSCRRNSLANPFSYAKRKPWRYCSATNKNVPVTRSRGVSSRVQLSCNCSAHFQRLRRVRPSGGNCFIDGEFGGNRATRERGFTRGKDTPWSETRGETNRARTRITD